jgi:glycosyltransferase involved in cell wall biosynthesis
MINSTPSNALVSIALCTYNGETHLIPQLDSLINQTYKNLEIVIVDDCSTDNTVNICTSYLEKDSRIRLFKNEQNIGFNLNFAKAISLCRGYYIAISDQDDIWCLNKIEHLINIWQEPTILMHHGYKIFKQEPLPPIHSKPTKTLKCINAKYILSGNFIQGCTIVFKKEMVDNITVFPRDIFYDWLLGVIAYQKGEIQYCSENLIYHRRHSTSAFYSIPKTRKENIETQMHHVKYFINNNILKADELEFANQLLKAYDRLFKMKYSFKTAWWFMRHRNIKYWDKNKKFPFFSNLIESIKRGRGVA